MSKHVQHTHNGRTQAHRHAVVCRPAHLLGRAAYTNVQPTT
jgi:hypothetical protein